MAFAEPTDVATAYEGSLPAGSEERVQYLLNTSSARLRLLLPDLESRMADNEDLALTAKDVVVQTVLGRLPGVNAQQVRSLTQQAGPFQTTQTYTTDRSGTFSDEDLDVLRGVGVYSGSPLGTIKLGLTDWSDQ